MEAFENYFLLFFVCAVFGWLMEVVCKLIEFKRFINRGFLIGPYCPIYGFGAVLVTVVLRRHASEPLYVFLMAMALCGVLEYLTSYGMEKLFHAKWWDYKNRRFNLNGRVCANTLIPFGLLGMALVYLVQPFFFHLFEAIPFRMKSILCAGLFCVMAADSILSATILKGVAKTADLTHGDNTETVTRLVREALLQKKGLHRRLLRAYPYAQLYNAGLLKKIRSEQEKIRADLMDMRKRLREDFERYEAKRHEK